MLPAMDGNDEFLPVESAGNLTGIPPRTLRYWIKGGKLPATEGPRGRLVKLADVLAIAELTGKVAPSIRQAAGNRQRPATSAETTAGNVAGNPATDDNTEPSDLTPATVSDAARSQLAAIRDEWLRPLVADIERLSQDVGRLAAERDAATRERDRAQAQLDADRSIADQLVDLLQAERDAALTEVARLSAAPPAPAPPVTVSDPASGPPWWRFWDR